MKGKYLSDIVNTNDIKQNVLNLIVAPTGAGKTFFCKSALANVSLYDTLYLIDTAMGKEQIKRTGAIEYNYYTEEPYWKINGITVMTYAGYATLVEKAPQYDAWTDEATIICDELQNPIQWAKWQANDIHKRAIEIIKERITQGNNTVVAISATPDEIRKEFADYIEYIKLNGEARHYENGEIINYSNLSQVLRNIKQGSRGIVYISHITDILKYQQLLKDNSIKTAAIWSINNDDHPMSDEQKRVREYILNNREMLADIDVLFINKSCETSITIGGRIDFMIVHSSDEDTKVQARGRYRADLPTLYLYDAAAECEFIVPEEYLNRRLSKADKDELCTKLDIRENGRLCKWTTVKKKLEKFYKIEDKKSHGNIYSIITR